MATTPEGYFAIPKSISGKSLRDIAGIYNFRSDLVANLLGIPETQRLTAGQQVTARNFDPGSSEGRFLTSVLSPGMTPAQQAAQPAIQTLESAKSPLKERYNQLLQSIKARGEQEVKQADIISARELGRRGISTGSTFAGEYQQERRVPVQTQFGQLEAETGLAGEQAIANIASKIAELQYGAGQTDIQRALELLKMEQQNQQFREQQALTRELNQPGESLLQTQVIEVGGRKKLVNTQTGQVIADLGVSKVSTGGGVSDYGSTLEELFSQFQ